jgi:hypothetical protein
MRKCWTGAVGLLLLALPAGARADVFDHYTNVILGQALKSKAVEPVKQLTPEVMVQHSRVLPGGTTAVVIVKTNEGRLAKLLVMPGQQKVSDTEKVPIVLVERFVTYREGEDRTVQASGQNLRLFAGFPLSLDIGQVVPDKLGGDVKLVAEGGTVALVPVGKAELYLLTKHLTEATPKKLPRPVVGEKFEARFFNGVFKLHDDGRRTGTLHLKVLDDSGEVEGYYYSDKDGQKYEVAGKVGPPNSLINFVITFPRTIQTFRGYMFTGDGGAITGTSRLEERETGFYAVRLVEGK